MTLDSLPDLDTSGLCLVKTLSMALTCWPYRNTALRDGARTSTRTSSVAKGRWPRYTAGPRRRGKPTHSHRGHPVPGPGNVAAKRPLEPSCLTPAASLVIDLLHRFVGAEGREGNHRLVRLGGFIDVTKLQQPV